MIGVLAVILLSNLPTGLFLQPGSRLDLFATVFLGIFIEALPYLLIGTLISGLVEVFLDRDQMARFISRRPVPAAVASALMGMLFPVCECGVIPLTRRLFHKGLPLSAGIAFLLAAAFGWGPMLAWRLGMTLMIASGEFIVISARNEKQGIDLWRVSRDGGELTRLLPCERDRCSVPAISSFDRRVAYVREAGGPSPELQFGATWRQPE